MTPTAAVAQRLLVRAPNAIENETGLRTIRDMTHFKNQNIFLSKSAHLFDNYFYLPPKLPLLKISCRPNPTVPSFYVSLTKRPVIP